MRIVVNWDLCESNAICMGIAPEIFEVREDDNLYVLQEEPSEESRPKVEEAVRDEHADLGFDGRFGAGLPRKSDGQLLFLLHYLGGHVPAYGRLNQAHLRVRERHILHDGGS